jgi:methionyl-tRNA formyltransferase
MVDSGVDTGDIIATREFLYPAFCRVPADYQRLYLEKNKEFICEFVEDIISSESFFDRRKQSHYLSSYWPRLSTEINGWIDWKEDIQSLDKFICAFDDPYEGAKTYLNAEQVHIKNVMADFSDNHFHPFQYGLVYRKGPSWLVVSVKGGSLIIQNISDEDGNDIFENVKLGDRLVTPLTKIQSRFDRVTYSPKGLNVRK